MAYVTAGYIITKGVDNGLVGTVATGITTMTSGIYHLVVSISTHENVDINKFIERLDIQYKMQLVEAVLNKLTESQKETPDSEFTLINAYDTGEKGPIGMSLHYLSQSIQKIHVGLDEINQQIICHQQKWFHGMRKLDIKNKLDELEKNTEILSKRFDDFLRILPVIKN